MSQEEIKAFVDVQTIKGNLEDLRYAVVGLQNNEYENNSGETLVTEKIELLLNHIDGALNILNEQQLII